LGNWQFVLVVGLSIIAFLLIKKKFVFIWPFILTVLGSSLVTFLAKIYFHRPRPNISVFAETGFSFPSGHATIAVALFAYLAWMIVRLNKRINYKLIYCLAVLIIILIGGSRIYLGAHYLSDVLVGYLVGFVGLLTGVTLTKKLIANTKI
jgi:undecaprenyl-diphosphatase